jgi:phosphoesterase RecJ-like protein
MKLVKILQSNRRIVVGTHFDPDGDAICSSLAIARFVRLHTDRNPVLFCLSPIPGRYSFLLRGRRFTNLLPDFDRLILIDAPGIDRVLPDYAEHRDRYPSAKIVNIDHHKSNNRFGALNIIDENASSACEIVYRIFSRTGIRVTRPLAEIFYAGIYAETGGFLYPNTTRVALKTASELVGIGIDAGDIAKKLNAKSLTGTRLLSQVLNTIEIRRGVGTMVLTRRMLESSGADMVDSENFVSFIQAIIGVRISVFLREETNGTRLSLRSDGIVDVDKIARPFGGGGHRLAAGIRMKQPFPVARRLILKAIFRELEKKV